MQLTCWMQVHSTSTMWFRVKNNRVVYGCLLGPFSVVELTDVELKRDYGEFKFCT